MHLLLIKNANQIVKRKQCKVEKNKTKKIKKKQICEKNERKCKYTFWHQNLIIMLREDWLAKNIKKETRYCFLMPQTKIKRFIQNFIYTKSRDQSDILAHIFHKKFNYLKRLKNSIESSPYFE